MGINSKGQVVGDCGQRKALFWDPAGGMRDIGPDANEPYAAVRVNDSGLVIGQRTRGYAIRAFVWDAKGGFRDLGTLGAPESECYGVNSAGVVVGSLFHQSDSAFIYQGPGEMRKLTEVGQDRPATAINDEGTVAGYRNYAEAWIWNAKTGRKDIGLCRGSQAVPHDINRHNQVVGVGYSGDRGYEPHVAWLWDAEGGMKALGTLGGAQSEAYSINDAGQVVGMAQVKGDKPHAFLYADGKMIDLNGLLPPGSEWELQAARDINNRGQIVGWGLHEGVTRAFLLTPKP
jgi:probable HAF family extracellular repeat protein